MKFILLILCFLLNTVIYSQGKFTITGTVPNELNNQKIYLIVRDAYSMNRYVMNDTTIVKQNRFTFSGLLSKPTEWAQIYTKSGFYYFALDTGKNTIAILPLQKNSPTWKNKLSNSKVTNSTSNTVYRSLYDLTSKYYLRFGRPAKENKGILQLDSVKTKELRQKEIDILLANKEAFYSLIYLYQIQNRPENNAEEIEIIFLQLGKNLQESELGKELNEKIQYAKRIMIGQKAPLLNAKTSSDSIFSSESLKGKIYLIAFGATWCLPCKEKYPFLVEMFTKYKQKGFEIVGVNLDEKKDLWKKQISTYGLTWINISELVKWSDSKISKLFDVQALPFYLLVNKEGIIIYNSFQLKDEELRLFEKYIAKLFQ
ncbi:MAG: thioredoxin-like domain-containing protein [Bacteroidota bacterium]